MLRCLCSASSIFPVVYLIKATATTKKMEDPEQKLFRMTSCLINDKRQTAIRLGFPITTLGNVGVDGTARPLGLRAFGPFLPQRKGHKNAGASASAPAFSFFRSKPITPLRPLTSSLRQSRRVCASGAPKSFCAGAGIWASLPPAHPGQCIPPLAPNSSDAAA